MVVSRRRLLARLGTLLASGFVGALGACGERSGAQPGGASASPRPSQATPSTPVPPTAPSAAGAPSHPPGTPTVRAANPSPVVLPTWTPLPHGGDPVLVATLPAIGPDRAYMRVAFSTDGRYLTVGNWGEMRLYRLVLQPVPRLEPLLERAEIIRGVAFSPDGTLTAVSYRDRIELWELVPLRLRATLQATGTPYTEFTEALTFSTNGDRLAADHGGNELFVWRTVDGAMEAVIPREVNPSPTLAFARDGRALLTVEPGWSTRHITRPQGLEVWDLAARARARLVPLPEPEGVIHSGGALVAWRAGGFAGERVAVWAPFGGGDPLLCAPYGANVPRRAVPFPWLSFTRDGDYLAGGAYDAVYVWRVADGALVHRVASVWAEPPDSTAVFGVIYVPEQRVILALYADGQLRVWNVPSIA